ncbi:invasion associated locus B family protein [Yoonia litorea]|uniref:Invasion protein IalB, involved in pathogenesis n=1 Tax=Yoonia litorea TaxID=1123755 RepID=A0A1I6M1C1_9RHOB|nr:invasion associated locus B family protein [Yoonia litorea]SFS09463.1 Invasion protein IalB, involved in pathogenesis [Yoonia litorea]
MRSILSSALLVLALAWPVAATAQEAAVEDNGDFDIGQSLDPAVGDTYIRETFGDWDVRCVVAPEGQQDPCNLYQLLLNDEGVSVAEFNVFLLPEGSQIVAGATFVVPLETFLPEALTLAVDGQNVRRYPYRFCNRAGCVARIGFVQSEIDEFKAGANGSLRIVPAAANDTEVILDISLSGFTAAFDSLTPPIVE